VKLLLAFFGLWVTPICHSGGVILLPEFGHQIPAALLNRFIKGGGAKVTGYREVGFKQLMASVRWKGADFTYYTDDWGGAQIEGDEEALLDLFRAMSRSSRTLVRVIPD